MTEAGGQRSSAGRRGPRTDGADTRTSILAAARAEFARQGYDGSSLRSIARVAGVDPALVHHYFGGKPDLFAEAMQLPVRPAELVQRVTTGPPEQLGVRLATAIVGIWEEPPARDAFLALLRSAVSHEAAARMMREFMARELFGRIAQQLKVPDPELRAGLAAGQMLGVALLRYVIGYEPLVKATPDQLVQLMAPTIQRYLTGDSPADASRASERPTSTD